MGQLEAVISPRPLYLRVSPLFFEWIARFISESSRRNGHRNWL